MFALKFSSMTTAMASMSLFSTFMVGSCETLVPLKSMEDLPIVVDGKAVETHMHMVDPWIRPPRGVETQQAIGMAGDFDLYPRVIAASRFDRIHFNMRPIEREGDNKQRHGVYVITDKQLVKDYLDGKSEHPCGEPVYTNENLCQVVEYQGLNATDCPLRETLFPLLEIFGNAGEISYTVSGLGDLADQHGVETENGNKVLAFDCPWIQGRNDEGGGRTSHCIGGMYLIVEVPAETEGEPLENAGDTSDGNQRFFLSFSAWSTLAIILTMF